MLMRSKTKYCSRHYQIRCGDCNKLILSCGCMLGSNANLGIATCAECGKKHAAENGTRLLKIKCVADGIDKADHDVPYQSPWPIC